MAERSDSRSSVLLTCVLLAPDRGPRSKVIRRPIRDEREVPSFGWRALRPRQWRGRTFGQLGWGSHGQSVLSSSGGRVLSAASFSPWRPLSVVVRLACQSRLARSSTDGLWHDEDLDVACFPAGGCPRRHAPVRHCLGGLVAPHRETVVRGWRPSFARFRAGLCEGGAGSRSMRRS